MAESEKELKNLLMKVKEESEKVGLNSTLKKLRSCIGHITSWQIDEETLENRDRLFSWAPKSLQTVTAAMKLKEVCSLEEML